MAAKNGYERLKARYIALEAKKDELQSTIEKQQTTISELRAKLKSSEDARHKQDKELDAMYAHMGWFRRLTWDMMKHND